MQILVVDDDRDRAQELLTYLVDGLNTSAQEVKVVYDAISARDALSERAFDLMVLDVMLPFRQDSEPDERTALDLLTEIYETGNLHRPRHIIGLTAYEAVEQAVSREFTSRSWVLVWQSPLNRDWIQTIGNAVKYIDDQGAQRLRDYDLDLAIVTALPLELEAIRKLPWAWMPDEVLDESQFVIRGAFDSGGKSYSVVAAVASRMGMVSASVLASKLITKFRPRVIAMPGICAGVRDKVALGDVICAETSWDYQSGKHVTKEQAVSGFQMDPHFIPADAFVIARIDQLARDDAFAVQVWRNWQARQAAPPALRRGPVASGAAVLADPAVTERIKTQQRKVIAVEMELYGVFSAAEQAARPKPIAIGLKSVCDFADDEKSDAVQPYAAYTSAAYLREFCERYFSQLA